MQRVCAAVKYTVYDVEDKYVCIFQFESNRDPLYKLGVPDISVNRENKLEISPFRPFFPSPWLTGVWQPIKALCIHSSSRGRTGTIFIVTVVGTSTHTATALLLHVHFQIKHTRMQKFGGSYPPRNTGTELSDWSQIPASKQT